MATILDCIADRLFDRLKAFPDDSRRSCDTESGDECNLSETFVRFEWTAFADRGTYYVCKSARQSPPWTLTADIQNIRESELRILQSPHYIPRGEDAYYTAGYRLSRAGAYRFLGTHLPPHVKFTLYQRHAYARLHEAWKLLTAETRPDLYIKVINDLDSVLFAVKLYKRVYLCWTDELLSDRAGRCSPPGGRVPRVMVRLDWRLVRRRDKAFVWGTVVHEMIHAFFMVVGDDGDLSPSSALTCCGGDGHDELFWRMADRLASVLCFRGFDGRDIIT